ncbi:MAG: glycosyltransferase family 4 protein [Spirochaetales bacterium]|nr:glycosyltransferase family 4 protein [Spirochaetales bacterium]
MRIALLSPIAWRTPPEHYGPWESIVSLLAEGLVEKGVDVTLFAAGNSVTKAKLHSICPVGYEEDKSIYPKVWECLHISEVFENANEYDLIHNHFDFLPLSYSQLVSTPVICTIHGFSSPEILPVYEKYNEKVEYIAISNADRHPNLKYLKTIYHGIDLRQFTFKPEHGGYLLFFGRIHPDKGTKEAIEIAKKSRMKLILAGIIQDGPYFRNEVKPCLDGKNFEYIGSVNPLQRDSLLGGAYALLHPINFNEPFGLSVIESMACGTPVIANNRGSMGELIQDKRNGYLVSDVREAVNAVREIPSIDRNYCRRTIEKTFTAEHMVNNYMEAYNMVLEKNE